jgi:hypothetical protein
MAIPPGSIKQIIDVLLRHPRDRSDQESPGRNAASRIWCAKR